MPDDAAAFRNIGQWEDETRRLLWKRTRLVVLLAALVAPVPMTSAVGASGAARTPYQAIDLSPTEQGIAVANAISSSGVKSMRHERPYRFGGHSCAPCRKCRIRTISPSIR